MVQIIPRDNNFGGQLGEALGTGLNQLAGLKLAQLTKQYEQAQEKSHFTKAWEPILGKNTAQLLSNFSPEERQNVLGNFEQLQQLNSETNQPNGLAALSGNRRNQELNQRQQDPRQQLQQALGQYFNNPTMGQQQQGVEPEQVGNVQQFVQQEPELNPERAKLVQQLFETPQQKKERVKNELDKRKVDLQERKETLAATKDYVNGLKEKEKATKEANLRLSRMEKLIEKGNLPNAPLWSALSKLEHAPFVSGLTAPIAELLKGGVKWYSGNPSDIEEFEKLSNEFVKNAKQYFGSRITQKEVELFMQTVPTLMQTDAGKKKLIENIRSLNELSEIESKAARSIIKANGGIPPIDIEQQVHDKIENKLDKVAQKFIVRE